jgi:hypothetical protein
MAPCQTSRQSGSPLIWIFNDFLACGAGLLCRWNEIAGWTYRLFSFLKVRTYHFFSILIKISFGDEDKPPFVLAAKPNCLRSNTIASAVLFVTPYSPTIIPCPPPSETTPTGISGFIGKWAWLKQSNNCCPISCASDASTARKIVTFGLSGYPLKTLSNIILSNGFKERGIFASSSSFAFRSVSTRMERSVLFLSRIIFDLCPPQNSAISPTITNAKAKVSTSKILGRTYFAKTAIMQRNLSSAPCLNFLNLFSRIHFTSNSDPSPIIPIITAIIPIEANTSQKFSQNESDSLIHEFYLRMAFIDGTAFIVLLTILVVFLGIIFFCFEKKRQK